MFFGCFAYAVFINAIAFGGLASEETPSTLIGGLFLMVLIASEAAVAAVLIGVSLALAQRYGIWIWRVIALATVAVLRGVPLLVALYAFVLIGPIVLHPSAAFETIHVAALVLALHAGALIAIAIGAQLASGSSILQNAACSPNPKARAASLGPSAALPSW
ncbi:MAG: hypothetical protein AAFP78_00885, partial [Pseudomonadota bacterium]